SVAHANLLALLRPSLCVRKDMVQMSSLDPQPRARSASDGGQTGAFRQSQPRVLSERLASFFKTSLKHESFKTVRSVEQNARVCVPFLEAHLFPTIEKKVNEPHPLSARGCHGFDEPRVDVDVRAVGGIELKEFHEDRAARLRTGRMARGRRIADVTARRIVTALVLKGSI